MIIQIKNASDSRKESVVFPYSKLKLAILDVLFKEGFIKSFAKKANDSYEIDVELAYDEEGASKIAHTERISKLSKRSYVGYKALRPVRSGFGMLVLSTPKGVMSGAKARRANVGGEYLAEVW